MSLGLGLWALLALVPISQMGKPRPREEGAGLSHWIG